VLGEGALDARCAFRPIGETSGGTGVLGVSLGAWSIGNTAIAARTALESSRTVLSFARR
jgi:hypothetical protein